MDKADQDEVNRVINEENEKYKDKDPEQRSVFWLGMARESVHEAEEATKELAKGFID